MFPGLLQVYLVCLRYELPATFKLCGLLSVASEALSSTWAVDALSCLLTSELGTIGAATEPTRATESHCDPTSARLFGVRKYWLRITRQSDLTPTRAQDFTAGPGRSAGAECARAALTLVLGEALGRPRLPKDKSFRIEWSTGSASGGEPHPQVLPRRTQVIIARRAAAVPAQGHSREGLANQDGSGAEQNAYALL